MNKVTSFWMAKRPAEMLKFYLEIRKKIKEIFSQAFLYPCINDLIIRIVAMQGIPDEMMTDFN